MSSTTLYRLSGISLLIGSLLTFIGTLPDTFNPGSISTLHVLGSVVNLIGIMLIVLGVPGMYARQAERAGILGLIGSILTVFFVLMAGYAGNIVSAFIAPFLAAHSLQQTQAPIGLVLFAFIIGSLLGMLGGILLGFATMRAAILPRWAGALLIAGGVLLFGGNFLPFGRTVSSIGVLLFLSGLAWLGAAVWSKPPTAIQAPLMPTATRT
jgi:hypothetical protein